MFDNKIFQPYHVKASKGLNLGFILSVLFCSKIENIERQLIYIFYIGNIIPHEFLKYQREKLNKEFLLKLIFALSGEKKCIPKKDLRFSTKLEDKGTFNKYFGAHIKKLGLSKNKSFTLYETFKILEFWQGDDKWGRMEAFSKGELAERFMHGNYNALEEIMIDEVFKYDEYAHHNYIKPADAKKLFNLVVDSESLALLYEEEFDVDCLFSLCCICNILLSLKGKRL
jgi:hypothetical protein